MKITQARSITVVNNKITIMSLAHEGGNKQKVCIFFDSTRIQYQSMRGAGTAIPSEAHEFTPGCSCVARSLVFCVVFCRSLFVLFLLASSLSAVGYESAKYAGRY